MASTEYLIAQNLKELMREEGLIPSELARKLEVKPPIVHRLLTGENSNPTLATLKIFTDYFKVSMGQLLGEVDLTPRLLHKKKQNARARLIPLIEQSTFNGKLSKSEKDYLVANIQLSQQAFAMKVTENNMNPAIPEGAIIVVEPTLKPSNNKFVLIKEGSGYHIKLYLSKENHHLLSASLNDFSTIKKITSKSVIIGTIIHIFFNEVI